MGDHALVATHLQAGERSRGDIVFRAGHDVSHVIFPLQGTVVTLLVPVRDGRFIETATVGYEGAVGGVVSEGYLPAFSQAVVQIAGPVLHIEASRLQEAKLASPTLRDLFVRYADCLLAQVLQSVTCTLVHPIEERCLRWLLTLQDRLGTPILPVTHELLADMLGVRRSYLTRILGDLQRRGLIRIGHGRVTLPDRNAAERACCECHARVRDHFRTSLGATYASSGRIVAIDVTSQPNGVPNPLTAPSHQPLAPTP
nr:Crp/Fnr family transcriptional regulator [Methylobacterium sp. WSM2598]